MLLLFAILLLVSDLNSMKNFFRICCPGGEYESDDGDSGTELKKLTLTERTNHRLRLRSELNEYENNPQEAQPISGLENRPSSYGTSAEATIPGAKSQDMLSISDSEDDEDNERTRTNLSGNDSVVIIEAESLQIDSPSRRSSSPLSATIIYENLSPRQVLVDICPTPEHNFTSRIDLENSTDSEQTGFATPTGAGALGSSGISGTTAASAKTEEYFTANPENSPSTEEDEILSLERYVGGIPQVDSKESLRSDETNNTGSSWELAEQPKDGQSDTEKEEREDEEGKEDASPQQQKKRSSWGSWNQWS